jgi:hypothetical protein
MLVSTNMSQSSVVGGFDVGSFLQEIAGTALDDTARMEKITDEVGVAPAEALKANKTLRIVTTFSHHLVPRQYLVRHTLMWAPVKTSLVPKKSILHSRPLARLVV